MSKYKPEKKSKLEKKVKDIDRRAKDHIKPMKRIAKKEARAITDASKKIISAGTIESEKEIKQNFQQAGREVGKEYGRKGKDLEAIVKNEGGKLENELRQRGRYSKLNYKELTKAMGNIKETSAARNKMNNGRHTAQKDTYTLDSLRDHITRLRKRTSQESQDLEKDLKKMGIYVSADSAKSYLTAHAVNEAVEAVKKNGKRKTEDGPLEGQIIPEEKQGHEFCEPVKEIFGEYQDEIERLKKSGSPPQDTKPHKPQQQNNQNNPAYGSPLGNEYKRDKS